MPAKPPPGRWRKWLYRLSAITLVPLLFLGLVEVILRLGGYGYPATFFVPRREIDGGQLYVENRFFGRHFFPQGLARTPEPCQFSAFKPDKTYRIFILGESAALGYPDPSVNFARILEVMLRNGYPGVRFEIVSTAMTAINSHVILPIARDCARHEPDLFVVYMGNNEVVGPYGTAGVLGPYAPNLTLIRASAQAKSLRLGQFLSRQMQWATGAQAERWEGMVMFAKSQVRADDPRMEAVYSNFASNLRDICAAGTGTGAKVVVSTVGTNLKESAPFASVPSAHLPDDQAEAFTTVFDEGVRLETAKDFAAAIEHYRRAAAIDSGVADLHFRMGRCLLATGKPAEAREQFILARDLDALRFRADSRINEAIRAQAGREAEGVYLVDVEHAFDRASGGIPGENLLYEHVHMNFAGNYELARAVFEQVTHILPDWATSQGSAGAVLAKQACMERLAFGDWKRLKALEIIYRIMQDPPFSDQFDRAERNERMRRQLEKLHKHFQSDGVKETMAVFRRALEHSDDVELHRDFAEFLLRFGEYAEAVGHLQKVVREEPRFANGYLKLALAWKSLGKYEQALALCADAARLDPEHADADNLRGAVFMEMGKLPEAVASFRQAVKINPHDDKAHFNLGLALATNGQLDLAIAAYDEALRITPKNASAHLKLAEVHAQRKEPDEAVAHFNSALQIDPNLIDAHIGLGITAFNRDRPDEALEHYRAALRINPKLPIVHFAIASVLSLKGNTREAIGHLEEAVRLQPGWADAQQALDELRQKK